MRQVPIQEPSICTCTHTRATNIKILKRARVLWIIELEVISKSD